MPHTRDSDVEQLRRERDLYRGLLELAAKDDVEPFLRDALRYVVEATSAARGYLELREEESGEMWWISHDCDPEQIDDIRKAVSRGIVAEVLATGETVYTPSARMDPRFRERHSVAAGAIGAVLCCPIGGAASLGALYLQGATQDGSFGTTARHYAETATRHLAPLAERLLEQVRRAAPDPTEEARRRLRLDGIVGSSSALARVLDQVLLVAPLDVTVLLTGASGSGKSQLARVIHDNGPRRGGPFIELNCATLPEALVESELFGAEPGAHSTATKAVPGKVAAANGGTLFLDEVGELPHNAQAKLLQLLQSKEFFALGGTRPVRADVRVIAATNVDLEHAVAERSFREDLFYRLHVLPVRLPSLSERPSDLPALAEHLAEQAADRHDLTRAELSPSARAALASADWPGNVRELGHVLEAAVIRANGEGSGRIERRHLFPTDEIEPKNTPSFQEATRQFQRELLRQTLVDTGWNVAEAARVLDVARSHVYTLIRAFGLAREPSD